MNWGTFEGVVSNAIVFGPIVCGFLGLRYLVRKGFFGPHQR